MKRVFFLIVGVSMFLGCMGLAVNRKPEPTSVPVADKDIEQSIQEEMQKDDLSAKIEGELPKYGYVSGFDVSPNGEEIVFAVSYDEPLDICLKSDIWKMDIDGRNKQRLTYTGDDPISKRAVVINKKGYKVRDMIPYKTIMAKRPKFSGRGNFVMYDLETTGYFIGETATYQPMVMGKDGSQQKKVKERVMSPDETKWVRFIEGGIEESSVKSKLVVFDRETDKSIKEILEYYDSRYGALDILWSPDSKKIAFTGSKEKRVGNSSIPVYLWVADLETGDLKELTWAAVGFNTISWSPDSKKIMIGTGGRETIFGEDIDFDKVSGVWVIDLEKNQEYKVSRDLRAGGGRWSQDGKNILFRGRLQDNDKKIGLSFYIASLDAVSLIWLKELHSLEYSFVWDNKYILYSSYGSGDTSLWLLSLDTKKSKKIVKDVNTIQKSAGDYQWVESKKGIVYIADDNLWFMDIETLAPEQLTDLEYKG